MLPVCHGDVVAVARVLQAMPKSQRKTRVEAIVNKADWAHSFFRKTGKVHRLWGDGSLQSVVSSYQRRPELSLDDRDYLGCLMLVFQALLAR